jgi:hypothetical protein
MNRRSFPRPLTPEEIELVTRVHETDAQISFSFEFPDFSVLIGTRNIALGESTCDTFARFFGLASIRKFPAQETCARTIALCDKHGVYLPEPLVSRVHAVAASAPVQDREAIDAMVEVIHGLLRSGCVLTAARETTREVLLGFDVETGRYFGSSEVEKYLALRLD